MNPTQLSVIIPIYNEKENLAPLLSELHDALNGIPDIAKAYEILAIDDGSHDGSTDMLRELAQKYPELKVVIFRKHAGQSAALDAGFHFASGAYVVTLDADLQNDPSDIPKLLSHLQQGHDVVTGWRKDRKDLFFSRRLPSLMANGLIRLIMKSRIHDLGCSLRAYRREILSHMRIYGELHRLLCPLLEMKGAKIKEVEVHHRPRRSGHSKYGLGRTFKVFLDLIFVWFQKNFLTTPMYAFGGVGILGLFIGGSVCLFTYYQKLAYGYFVHRNPLLLIGIGLMITGLQFVSIGVLAEVLIRTYFESQGKPAYYIDELIRLEG